METKLIELNAIEIREISGGNLYDIGKAVGSYCADCIDFYHGIIVGLFS